MLKIAFSRFGAALAAAALASFFLFAPASGDASETTLFSFCKLRNCVDGSSPVAGLTHIGGTLYGTTSDRGIYGGGTALSIDLKSGKEVQLHAFGHSNDGVAPFAGLLPLNGLLYGTTLGGGTGNGGLVCTKSRCHFSACTLCGTVFSLDPKTRAETVLYTFCRQQNCVDGQRPYAGLISVNGLLYGTTSAGGAHGGGTVFSVDPITGAETVLYSFCSQNNCMDGANPVSSLIDVKGILYSTTENGGGYDCGGVGCGTVFSLNPSTGAEAVLHAFKNDSNGFFPLASLINVKGNLYGTTVWGGDYEGVVFSVSRRTGAETVVYAFCSQGNCTDDGRQPQASLVYLNGMLYGTTFFGGGTGNGGAVFSIDATSGSETVVYSFCSESHCPDGLGPEAGLINIKGTLYGTTQSGGTPGYTCGGSGNCGTVYAITP